MTLTSSFIPLTKALPSSVSKIPLLRLNQLTDICLVKCFDEFCQHNIRTVLLMYLPLHVTFDLTYNKYESSFLT